MVGRSRPEDTPLHEDVRWLAATLGDVIRRLEGDEAFTVVEELRRACRARRHGEPDAPTLDALLERVRALPLPMAAVAARAFTLFFLLINTAEQVHRVRRRLDYLEDAESEPQPASARWTMKRLRQLGRSADDVERALAALDVRPVLTAHPTESTRRTLLSLQARVAGDLLARDGAPLPAREALDESLRAEVELLWLTSEVRRDRPSVLDEVSTVLWYLEDRLVEAERDVRASLERAFLDEFGRRPALGTPLRFGSWVGGDRDGNPYVTPEITLAAVRRASYAILGRYRELVDALVQRLSLSDRRAPVPDELRAALERDREQLPAVWEANRRRDQDEPVRLELAFIAARLDATRRLVASRDAGRPEPVPAAYASAVALERDLGLVRDALLAADAEHVCRTLLEPVLALVRAHGFYGYVLDVRDHAKVHAAAVDAIARLAGIAPLDHAGLERELLGRRPLLAPVARLDDATQRVVDVFRTIRQVQEEVGEAGASTYIISMARSADDLLRVLLLAREAGLVDLAADEPWSRLDVAPLFETLDDLEHAPAVVRELLADPVWQRQLRARGMRQEIMIGYSDSAKDAGILPSAWALHRAQAELSAVGREAGVAITFFHGRGGTVGRGGGSPVYRALAALPPGSVHDRIKVTEQGEVISQKFGLLPIAERSLEVLLSGTLLHGFTDWREDVSADEAERFRLTMDRLASLALPAYRETVHEGDALFRFFLAATPVKELAHVHFGSRPVYREGGTPSMEGLRAIPWNFGWTQMRLMLPGWLGVGTALETVLGEEGGLALLRRMAERWPFFDDLLSNVEMVCAKADPTVARMYAEHLGGDMTLFDQLEREYRRTVDAILRIRGADALLLDSPVLRSAIALRNPYVDPLSLLQVALLERKRALPDDAAERAALDEALGTTLNGVAQGLRNTG